VIPNHHRDLRASMTDKDIPEDLKLRLLALHEENISLKESNKTAHEKLVKAKQVNTLVSGRLTGIQRLLVHQVTGQAV